MSQDYYVYQLTYAGRVLYIGCGYKNRLDHVLSCKSHNIFLNRFVSFGYLKEELSLTKIHEGLNKEVALAIEKELIIKSKPLFNSVDNDSGVKDEAEHYLQQHQFNRMFDVLGWGKSEPYLKNFTTIIQQLESRCGSLIEENERLKSALRNIDLHRGSVVHGNFRYQKAV